MNNIDRTDRAILRVLFNARKRELSTNEISIKVGLSPVSTKNRLITLFHKGYVLSRSVGKIRQYRKGGKIVRAESKRLWRAHYR